MKQDSDQGVAARLRLGLDELTLDTVIADAYHAFLTSLDFASASTVPQFRILQALLLAISFE